MTQTDGGDDPVIAPSLDDSIAGGLSAGVGGPLGEHAGRHRWWTPLRVVLAMTAVCFALGFVQKTPCYTSQWNSDETRYSDLCYSDLPYLYVGRGFAELQWPYSDNEQVRERYDVMEYPVGISYYAWVTAYATHWLNGSPDISDRAGMLQTQLTSDKQVEKETLLYVVVNGVGFGIFALLAAWFLVGVNRRRPWDAALFALSPLLLFDGLINWDLLAVVCVAGALWAHARGRPVAVGVMIGLGAASKLYPLFLIGPLAVIWLRQRRYAETATAVVGATLTWALVNAPAYLSGKHEWSVFWSFNAKRGADLGSVWIMVDQAFHVTSSPHTINVVSWLFFGVWCVGVATLGFLAPRTPRLAQLGFLVVAGFLLVNKVYSPQYALWLLPLAVMARPRWRDQLIWQAGELFYYASVWWYLGNYLTPGQGGDAGFYWLAIVIRMAAELYLVGVVVRDLLLPWHDPVPQDPLQPEPHDEPATTRGKLVGV